MVGCEGSCIGSWTAAGIHKHRTTIMTDLAAIYCLRKEDIPGASLSGKSAEDLNVEQLKWWLACRGAHKSGRKAELVQRYMSVELEWLCSIALWRSSLQGEGVRSQSEEVCMGLDKNIIDPDKGANIAKKLERLQVSGVNAGSGSSQITAHLQSQMKAGRQTWQICRLSPLPPCTDILWSDQPSAIVLANS